MESIKIIDKGFEQFSKGNFGNSGNNIYVSAKGNLQRIHHFDVNGDGYIDLPFANSHDDDNRVPAYVYINPLDNDKKIELPTDGAFAGVMADLNGDGYDDLVIANQYNGVSNDVYAMIYYGSPKGMSEKFMQKLWAPQSIDVVIGDFNGDGRKDIAFISLNKIRIFYQGLQGFRTGEFIEIETQTGLNSLAADDLDRDGFDDLIVRFKDASVKVFWGGKEGISNDNVTTLDEKYTGIGNVGDKVDAAASGASSELSILDLSKAYRLKTVRLNKVPHIFIVRNSTVLLISINKSREFNETITLECNSVMSAAIGDINGDGIEDIILATREIDENDKDKEISWIYWGTKKGYSNADRTPVYTTSVRDVVVGDLDGDGFDDIVFCQDRTEEVNSIESFIYKGKCDGVADYPVRLKTHCAVDAFIARTCDMDTPQVVFVNRLTNHILGNISSYIYLGGKDGYTVNRKIELKGWAATEIRMCDFNDDGYIDAILSNSNENASHLPNPSFLYMGGPKGFSENNRVELPTRRTMSTCCADLNKDGYLDLVMAGYDNDQLCIFYGSESGFTQEPVKIDMNINGIKFKEPRYMTLADLNNNGWLDIVIPQVRSDYFLILWGGPEGYSKENVTLMSAENTVSSRVADLDGDGWPDLVVGSHSSVETRDPFTTFVFIYWGGPKGYSNDRRTQIPASFACDISIADFNNDGYLDIFVNNYHGLRTRDLDSYIYWGNKDSIYSESNSTKLSCHSASGSLAADFNGDGWIDIAVANHKTNGNHSGFSYIWWNGPDGFSEDRITKLPTFGPHGMSHQDVGDIMNRGPEEFFYSRVIEIPKNALVNEISWIAEIPVKTWVKAQIRVSDSEENLSKEKWIGAEGENSWFENGQKVMTNGVHGTWLQYRLALGAVNSGNSPRVSEVIITCEPK